MGNRHIKIARQAWWGTVDIAGLEGVMGIMQRGFCVFTEDRGGREEASNAILTFRTMNDDVSWGSRDEFNVEVFPLASQREVS